MQIGHVRRRIERRERGGPDTPEAAKSKGDGRLEEAKAPAPALRDGRADHRSRLFGVQGYPISDLNGQWIHVAGAWDRNGITGSSDTVRLYLNGEVVAASQASDWGTTPCVERPSPVPPDISCFIDVVGCNDTCADTFAVDDLKVWGFAKTGYPRPRG